MDGWQRQRQQCHRLRIKGFGIRQSIATALQEIPDRLTHVLDALRELDCHRGDHEIRLRLGRQGGQE